MSKLLLSDYLKQPITARLSIFCQSVNPGFKLNAGNRKALLLLIEDWKAEPSPNRYKNIVKFLGSSSAPKTRNVNYNSLSELEAVARDLDKEPSAPQDILRDDVLRLLGDPDVVGSNAQRIITGQLRQFQLNCNRYPEAIIKKLFEMKNMDCPYVDQHMIQAVPERRWDVGINSKINKQDSFTFIG
jgi:hypothetical protein